MAKTTAEKRAAFRALHQKGCFLIPNPWDVGSARLMESLGFEALASTSAGFAWTQGRPDYGVTRDVLLAHLATMSAATDLPLNADFESGFAVTPEEIAANVGRVIASGVSGFSIEDRKENRAEGLYPLSVAVERIRAARAAVASSGHDVLLVARTETLLDTPTALTQAIDRLVAFADAGADLLFAPGVFEKADIAAMVKAVAPKPLNVLVLKPGGLTVPELADLGVRRISLGGSVARVAFGSVRAALEQVQKGTFDVFATGMPGKELNAIMGQPR